MALIQVTIKKKTKKQPILINTDHIVSMIGNCITLDTGTEMTIVEDIDDIENLAGGKVSRKPRYITVNEIVGFNHGRPWEYSVRAETKIVRIDIYDIDYIDTTTISTYAEDIPATRLVLKNKKKHVLVEESKAQVNELIRQVENENA